MVADPISVYFQIGIYVVMFLEILQTLIKVLFVFSILIIAFGLAFYILMSKVKYSDSTQHSPPPPSLSLSLSLTLSLTSISH